MNSPGVVDIDLGALARNYAALTKAAAPGACAAVVKADAYGLGIEPVARCLESAGCRHFFVATPDEGLALRRLLPDPEILVLDGLCAAEPALFANAGLIPALNTLDDLERWGRSGPAAVHVDTGMNRLGLSTADVDALVTAPSRLAGIDVRYVMTHLACADEPGHALNRAQLETFTQARRVWPEARTSINNSAGVLLGEMFRSDLARPGIALYGGNPFQGAGAPIEPVVSVRARILQIREVAAGETIGYGASFVAEAAMRVAVVGIGYADGYLRSLGNRGVAEVAGERVPVVGRISMDLVCLDVSGVDRDGVRAGDWATMLGGSVTLEELADLAGTINYELLTALGARLAHTYREDAGLAAARAGEGAA